MEQALKKYIKIWLPLLGVCFAFLPLADPFKIFSSLQKFSFDTLQIIKPRNISSEDPVIIIDIDDLSLQTIGQWPWPRNVLAAMVDRTLPAAALGFDMVFAEPDRTSPNKVLSNLDLSPALQSELRKLPDNDNELAQSIYEHGTVVLGQAPNMKSKTYRPQNKFGIVTQGDGPKSFLQTYSGTQQNLSLLEDPAAGIGSMSIGNNEEIVRQLPTFEVINGQIIPSLALEIVRVAIGANTYQIKSSNASSEAAFGEKTGINNIKLGPLTMPTNFDGNAWIYFAPIQKLNIISAASIFADNFDPSIFEGKVALVGTSASGLLDLRSNPIEQNVPGVTIIAQHIQQIFSDTFLQRPDWLFGAEFLIGIFLAFVLTLMIQNFGPISGLVAYIVSSFSITGLSYYLFSEKLFLVDPVSPLIIALGVYIFATFFNFLFTELERGRVRSAFAQYLSPEMVNKLADSSETLKLGGEKKEMTFLFSDIRGFTKIAENYQGKPEELTNLINMLLGTLSEEILKEEGTIDKYMGDCIMAFWNAPTNQPDHALRALRAAKNMKKAILQLNTSFHEQGMDAIDIGIGINTGDCVVGNMGSEKRFDYTVLGDAVNLASRLEGQSSEYGVDIVLGEKTVKGLRGENLLELDMIAVKGKTEPIRIFTNIDSGDASFEKLELMQAKMLNAYRNRQWDLALELLMQISASSPALKEYTELFIMKINEFKITPPTELWNGVTFAKTK